MYNIFFRPLGQKRLIFQLGTIFHLIQHVENTLLIQSNRNSIPWTDVATCSCSGPQILCVLGGASEHRQCLAGAQDIRGTSNMVPESTATRHAPTRVRTTPRDQGRVQERGGVIQRTSTFNTINSAIRCVASQEQHEASASKTQQFLFWGHGDNTAGPLYEKTLVCAHIVLIKITLLDIVET